ncbi:TIGR02679 family protein [Amphibacillus jilinensis]|uniref:TIGR02679 family protein n=1 Tax=Amphibacillus jilinensis TaxID=1216008 RepID=UPI00031FF670|nr:TIGR02679 family protein [Amphibacillus jilinensis]
MKEAIDYFRGGKGFHRLFVLFKKRYESLGRVGGTVKLTDWKDEELADIAFYFGLSESELKKKGKVSLDQFEQQLKRTKFEHIGLQELLEAYFGESLVSKKEAKALKDQQQQTFLKSLQNDFPALYFWFQYLQNKSADTYWIYRWMEKSEQEFYKTVELLNVAITSLPEKLERLPMFSQRMIRNPHAFDRNTNLGKLWIHVLAVHRQEEGTVFIPTDSEGINDLLLQYNILRDDITNYVTCANLLAETKRGVHSMWRAATSTESVLNAPLRELVTLTSVYPENGLMKVWIVENSGVYSSILDDVPYAPIICTHGQFKLAALLLMDRLVENGCELYYAGDFDPEGLSMAARLMERYPENARLWNMDEASYKRSQADVDLPPERMNKLASIANIALAPVVSAMEIKKKAGYQEALVDQMVSDLRREIGKKNSR